MSAAFLRMLWSTRDRRKSRKPNPLLQERLAWFTLHPARNVRATPVKPPVKDEPRG